MTIKTFIKQNEDNIDYVVFKDGAKFEVSSVDKDTSYTTVDGELFIFWSKLYVPSQSQNGQYAMVETGKMGKIAVKFDDIFVAKTKQELDAVKSIVVS